MISLTVTHSPYFSARLHLAVSRQLDHPPRMRSRRRIAGGRALAATPFFSVALRHVGKRRPHASLRRYGLAALGLIGVTLQAADPAAAQQADKSAYTFFRPTPDKLLRELSTDRPDATESPFTVDAGHVQLEMDFANATRNRLDGVRTKAWEVAPFNLRLGLTQCFELGVFVTLWQREIEQPRVGPSEKRAGFGASTLRGKLNLGGNEGGPFAWGLMADLKLPKASGGFSNGKCEGALILPVAFELGGGWGGGAMTFVELRSTVGGHYRAVWGNTVTVGYDITEKLGGFVELTSSVGDAAHVATFNCGLTYAWARDVQLDCGVNLGSSRSAPDAQFFAGISQRF